jgi:hypothetical protein
MALRGKLIDPRTFDRAVLRKSISSLFGESWTPVDDNFAERILKSALARGKPDPRNKAKRLVCVGANNKIRATTILLPKRGGSVKALLSTTTSDLETLNLMIDEVRRLCCSWNSRKIYFLHPLLDTLIVELLKGSQFQMEGFLRAPYQPGQDVGIFSRFC